MSGSYTGMPQRHRLNEGRNDWLTGLAPGKYQGQGVAGA
jgi:hypothetical protein